MKKADGKSHPLLDYFHIYYSYARVSLTVKRDALLAGNALAIVARTRVMINQTMIPLRP